MITTGTILCVFVFLSLILNGASVQTVIAGSEVNTVSRLRFSEPVNLTNNQHDSVYAQVATQGSNVYMVWQENPQAYDVSNDNPNYDIFMKKSIDGGLTFDKEINLSNNPGFSEHPQIAASGSNVYIVWIDNSPIGTSDTSENKKILFRKSVDQGNTFDETSILSSNNNNVDSTNQELTATGNNVYVVWQDAPLAAGNDADIVSGGYDSSVIFASSENSGKSFMKQKSLSNDALKSYPKVGAYEDSVFVVWNVGIINRTSDGNSQNGMGPNGVFFSGSSDNGLNFSEPLKLNANGESVGESQVATNGKNVYVVWGGNPDEKVAGNLYYTRSATNGSTFSTPQSLTDKNTLNVEVAADDNNAFIAWQGVLPDGNEEIFLKESSDAGDTFTMTNENISKNKGISECTSIAISQISEVVYLAWEDSPNDNHEILFSQGA
jgi:hypothetical protein